MQCWLIGKKRRPWAKWNVNPSIRKSKQVYMPAARRCKLNKKSGHPWRLGWRETWGQYRLWWRSASVNTFRGMEQFDWLWKWVLHQPRFTLRSRLLWWWTSSMHEEMIWMSSFWGHLKSSDKKLDLWRTPIRDFFIFIFNFCFSILSGLPTVTSNRLVTDGALLHNSLNQPLDFQS